MGVCQIDDWLYWDPNNEPRSTFLNSQVVVLEEIRCGSDHYPLQWTFELPAAEQPTPAGTTGSDDLPECETKRSQSLTRERAESPDLTSEDEDGEGDGVEDSSDDSDRGDEGYASGDLSDDIDLGDVG
jgi:hypothetical protein